MKHILNNLTEEEKNSIREQHTGGMKVMTENFSKLLNSKLGDSKPLVSEQIISQNYQEIANYLYDNMKGLSSSKNAENIKITILNSIKNKNDWEGLKKAFGVKDGENLEQWLKGEMRINLDDIMKTINQNDSSFRKEDANYNPGSKIRLITNRQFIMARAYQFSDIMRDKEELELDIENATVIRRDKDGIVIKAPYVYYYNVGQRKRGEQLPKQEKLTDPCIKIPFRNVIEWRDDTLQIRWMSDFVPINVVPCK
jgi:hypothetical protein